MNPISRKRPLDIPSPIGRLPAEIFAEIFTYLQEREDLHSAYLTCKRFKVIIDQWPKNYFRFYIENNPLETLEDLNFMQKFAPRLESFALTNLQGNLFSQAQAFHHKITHITLRSYSHIEEYLLLNSYNLKSLDVSSSDRKMLGCLNHLPASLETLYIDHQQLNIIDQLPRGLLHLIIYFFNEYTTYEPTMNRFHGFKDLKSVHIHCLPNQFKEIFDRTLCPLTIVEGEFEYTTPGCQFSCPIIARNLTFQIGECLYEGPLENGLPHGQGRLKYRNETVFQGVFKKGVTIEGEGWLILKDKKISNFWTNSVIFRYEDGTSFSGNMNGEGVLTHSCGRKFSGTFKNGRPYTGSGYIKYLNEYSRYEGGLLNGKPHGFGCYFDNNSYEGYFKHGEAVGSFLVTMPGRAPFKTNHPLFE